VLKSVQRPVCSSEHSRCDRPIYLINHTSRAASQQTSPAVPLTFSRSPLLNAIPSWSPFLPCDFGWQVLRQPPLKDPIAVVRRCGTTPASYTKSPPALLGSAPKRNTVANPSLTARTRRRGRHLPLAYAAPPRTPPPVHATALEPHLLGALRGNLGCIGSDCRCCFPYQWLRLHYRHPRAPLCCPRPLVLLLPPRCLFFNLGP
jgi:hypothetical protein